MQAAMSDGAYHMLHLMWKTLKVCIRKSAMKNTLITDGIEELHFGKWCEFL